MVASICFLRSRISAETSSRTAGIVGSLFLYVAEGQPTANAVCYCIIRANSATMTGNHRPDRLARGRGPGILARHLSGEARHVRPDPHPPTGAPGSPRPLPSAGTRCAERPRRTVGPARLRDLALIGRGGMGVVYRAPTSPWTATWP